MKPKSKPTRRNVVQLALLGTAGLLVGCRRDEGSESSETAEPGAGSGPSGSAAGNTTNWAVGGTAAMAMKASYPDPFARGGGSSCDLTCQATEGPCTADTTEREDVSESLAGLPVRLVLRVVNDACAPVAGARLQIWHTQRSGVYSGKTPSGSFCYGKDPEAENHLYFRGYQTTDEDGVVAFDTCFPGWYSSRAPHIHFQIRIGEDLYLTSQFVFADDLCAEIYRAHPDYREFGLPDTTLATDTVLGGVEDPAPYILDFARMEDGVMLASKTITVRSDLGASLCGLEGADRGPGGPGGPGGPPPGGRGGPPPGGGGPGGGPPRPDR